MIRVAGQKLDTPYDHQDTICDCPRNLLNQRRSFWPIGTRSCPDASTLRYRVIFEDDFLHTWHEVCALEKLKIET